VDAALDRSRIGLSLGAARVAVGVGFLAAPVTSTRVLGLDTSTAKRITFLARMTAVRDLVLGGGALASRRDPKALRRWVLAGAVADLGDALAIAAATRSRVAGGAPAIAITVGAVGAALTGGWAAAGRGD
jgi:hypothetical protein